MKLVLFISYNTTMKAYIIFCFIITTCCSCSSQILIPSWFDHKVDSRKHNWLDHNGITIIAEHIEVNDQLLVFDVEIKNELNHRLRFHTEEMYLMCSNTPYPTDIAGEAYHAFESNLEKRFALTENEVADYFRHEIKKQKRTALVTGILTAGLMVVNAAMDVNAMNKEWSPKVQRQEDLRHVLTFGGIAAMDIVRGQAGFSAMKARDDLHFLSEEILDQTVISPGQSFRGKVFFKATQSKFVRLIVPVGSNEFALDFRWASRKEERKLVRAH